MELVPRRVLGVPGEDVARDEAGFADPIEKLIAPLLRRIGRTAGEGHETTGGSEPGDTESTDCHLHSIR